LTGLRVFQMGGPNERSVHVIRMWGGCDGRATSVPPQSAPTVQFPARPSEMETTGEGKANPLGTPPPY
jgi:hypothetical protein